MPAELNLLKRDVFLTYSERYQQKYPEHKATTGTRTYRVARAGPGYVDIEEIISPTGGTTTRRILHITLDALLGEGATPLAIQIWMPPYTQLQRGSELKLGRRVRVIDSELLETPLSHRECWVLEGAEEGVDVGITHRYHFDRATGMLVRYVMDRRGGRIEEQLQLALQDSNLRELREEGRTPRPSPREDLPQVKVIPAELKQKLLGILKSRPHTNLRELVDQFRLELEDLKGMLLGFIAENRLEGNLTENEFVRAGAQPSEESTRGQQINIYYGPVNTDGVQIIKDKQATNQPGQDAKSELDDLYKTLHVHCLNYAKPFFEKKALNQTIDSSAIEALARLAEVGFQIQLRKQTELSLKQ